jgi:HEAT repeat protein
MIGLPKFYGIAFVLLGVAFAASGFRLLFPREPVYDGQSLSAWVADLCGGCHEKRSQAVEAFQCMGPDALVPLVEMMGARDSQIKSCLMSLLAGRRLMGVRFTSADEQRQNALRGFCVLGPAARAAIPALSELLEVQDVCMDAIAALAVLGKDAVPSLIHAMSSHDEEVRDRAALALGSLREDAAEAVPCLLRIMKDDTEDGVRISSAVALGRIRSNSPSVVPALMTALDDPNPVLRRTAVNSLRLFRGESVAAVPLFIRLMNDPDPGVRITAAIALPEIGKGSDGVITALINALEDSDATVQRFVIRALRGLRHRAIAGNGELELSAEAASALHAIAPGVEYAHATTTEPAVP